MYIVIYKDYYVLTMKKRRSYNACINCSFLLNYCQHVIYINFFCSFDPFIGFLQ